MPSAAASHTPTRSVSWSSNPAGSELAKTYVNVPSAPSSVPSLSAPGCRTFASTCAGGVPGPPGGSCGDVCLPVRRRLFHAEPPSTGWTDTAASVKVGTSAAAASRVAIGTPPSVMRSATWRCPVPSTLAPVISTATPPADWADCTGPTTGALQAAASASQDAAAPASADGRLDRRRTTATGPLERAGPVSAGRTDADRMLRDRGLWVSIRSLAQNVTRSRDTGHFSASGISPGARDLASRPIHDPPRRPCDTAPRRAACGVRLSGRAPRKPHSPTVAFARAPRGATTAHANGRASSRPSPRSASSDARAGRPPGARPRACCAPRARC